MKTNKDILSLNMEEDGYPFVKLRSLRTVIYRLKKTEKNLKSKRNEVQTFYNSQFVTPNAVATVK